MKWKWPIRLRLRRRRARCPSEAGWPPRRRLPTSLKCEISHQPLLGQLDLFEGWGTNSFYGAGEWQREKHGGRGRRTWRKLHLAVNPDSGEVLASELTTKDIGDLSMVQPLLDQISGESNSLLADGAYDGEPVYRAVAERRSQLPPY